MNVSAPVRNSTQDLFVTRRHQQRYFIAGRIISNMSIPLYTWMHYPRPTKAPTGGVFFDLMEFVKTKTVQFPSVLSFIGCFLQQKRRPAAKTKTINAESVRKIDGKRLMSRRIAHSEPNTESCKMPSLPVNFFFSAWPSRGHANRIGNTCDDMVKACLTLRDRVYDAETVAD